jgi:L-rhamnose mutarotase
MQRFARVSKLLPGAVTEYDRQHAEVWPDVIAAIDRAGIRNYTLFRHETWLFSYFELPEEVAVQERLAILEQSETCRRWEARMRTLRDPAFDHDWIAMREVFHHSAPTGQPRPALSESTRL